uniref:Uncharacterized protein n=1 Tax=Janibacter limosus TaxID=53458 RepID=A0AC61U6T3_9MICO|nr:hypothetical protein [Janibacter limosus]
MTTYGHLRGPDHRPPRACDHDTRPGRLDAPRRARARRCRRDVVAGPGGSCGWS